MARQGSLADRHLPAGLARRQNSNPSDPGAGGSGGSGCVSQDEEGSGSEEEREQTAVRFQVGNTETRNLSQPRLFGGRIKIEL